MDDNHKWPTTEETNTFTYVDILKFHFLCFLAQMLRGLVLEIFLKGQ